MNGDVLRLPPIDAHALWADTYDRDPNPILSLEERTVEPLLPGMAGMLALDVACGTGRWLRKLARRGAALAVGLDISPEMLGRAGRKRGLGGKLLQADSLAMPVLSSGADLVICSFGLSYMTSLHGFAQELSRVVKDHGHLFLTDFHPSAEARGWKRRFRHNGTLIEVSSLRRPVDRIREAFAGAGFELAVLVEPQLGEAERPVFEECGKGHLFPVLPGGAAIFVGHFTRKGRPALY